MGENVFKKVEDLINNSREEVIYLEKELTSRPAISPKSGGKGELKKALFIEEYLKKIGIKDITKYDAPDPSAEGGIRPNIIARIKGEDSSRSLWIMSHTDVVPEGDLKKWTSDPWEIKVEGDKIFGRGVEDNQQGIVASLIMAKALIEANVKPAYDIAMLFVADEEVGSTYGIKYILEKSDIFKKEDLIIIPDGGLSDGSMIEVAEKGIMWLKFTIMGKQSHASMPEKGNNAHRAGAHLIVKLNDLYNIFNARNEIFDPPISTFEPTKKETNVPAVNIIPGEDIFYLDCRLLPQYNFEELESKIDNMCKEIEDKFKVKVSKEFQQKESAAPPTSPESQVVVALKKAVKEVYNVEAKPMGIGGGTVAAHIRKRGCSCAVWARLDETMHGPNEYALISNIIGDAKVFAHISLNK